MLEQALEKLPQQFTSKLEITEGCWFWKAYRDKDGYGHTRVDKKSYLAHRYSWILFNGEIPSGLYVLHKCDTPSCVNPNHLFLGTPLDNTRDMIAKNRKAIGENHGNAKLTKVSVEEIRKMYKRGGYRSPFNSSGLAKRFGVSPAAVLRVVNDYLWKE